MTAPAPQPGPRSAPLDAALAPTHTPRSAASKIPPHLWIPPAPFDVGDERLFLNRQRTYLRWLYGPRCGYMEIVGGTPILVDGKPGDKIDLVLTTRLWAYIDPERPDLLDRAARHILDTCRKWGNVYVSRTLYRKEAKVQNKRVLKDDKGKVIERYALPSPIVFSDDCHTSAPLPFNIVIRTSQHSRHGYYRCNANTTRDDARRVAAGLGADPSGDDDEQLVRLPGTFNTKGGGCFPVTVEYADAGTTDLIALRAAYPPVSSSRESTRPPGSSSSGGRPAVDMGDWSNLPDGRALLTSGRYQWIIHTARPQLKQLIIDKVPVITCRKNGQADDSLSAQRAVLVNNLLELIHPPPLSEIRAVAWALRDELGGDKTDTEYCRAIDNEIGKYLPKDYHPSPTKGIKRSTQARPAPQLDQPKRPRGRQRGQRAAALDPLRQLLAAAPTDDFGVIHLDCTALAAALGRSARMVRNYLHDLASQKEIKFVADGKGRKLAIRFGTPDHPASEKEIKSAPVEPISEPVLASETPQTANDDAPPMESTGSHRYWGGCVLSMCARVEISSEAAPPAPAQPGDKEQCSDQHVDRTDEADQRGGCGERTGGRAVVLSAPAAPLDCEQRDDRAHADEDDADRRRGDETTESATLAPALADLAAHYLSMPATAIGERFVNEKTGTVVYRRTARHFAALVVEHYGDDYTRADAIAAYTAERARLAELVRQEWERFFRRLKAMSDDELIAYIAGRCRTEVAELAREGAIFDKHLYRTRLKCAKQHLEWRRLKMPDPKPGRRSLAPGRSPRSQTPAPAVASLQLDSSPQHRALM
jgi:hypothetical protein